MFKDGDLVKIKPEWCDGELDKKSFYILKNVNEKTRRCDICLVDAKRLGFPLGLVNTVSFDMIELVKKVDTEENKINQFVEMLKKEPMVQKNLCKEHWLSGSSTIVYPIGIWKCEIVLQWKSNKPCNVFISKMVEKSNGLIKSGVFYKSDGSCPNTVIFYFN